MAQIKNNFKNMLIPLMFALAAIFIPGILIQYYIIDAYTAQILTLAAINTIMAISVNIICGITGQLSLGQAGFMAIGAYSCIIFTQNFGIPMYVSIVLAGLFTALASILIGFPTLKLKGDYLAIVTLGFGEIIRVLLVNLKDLTGGPNGIRFEDPQAVNMTLNSSLAWYVIIIALVIIIILLQNFLRSTYGRAILAVREDETAASSSGINAFRYKMVGFVVASFVAGIGGALYAPFLSFIKPELASFNRSIDYLIFVVLGGMGSITGSVIAAFTLTFLQEFLRFLQDFRLIIYPIILILVMLFRPQGLLGMKELSFVNMCNTVTSFYKTKLAKKKGSVSIQAEEKTNGK